MAGDIVAMIGMGDVIGETICDPLEPKRCLAFRIDESTLSMRFYVNTAHLPARKANLLLPPFARSFVPGSQNECQLACR